MRHNIVRNILITSYILIVLGISAAARAATPEIDRAELIPGSLMVKIGGLYQSDCPMDLTAHIADVSMSNSANHVALEISEKRIFSDCTDSETQYHRFELAIDLKNLGLADGEHYSFDFLNPVTTNDDGLGFDVYLPKNALGSEFPAAEHKGELVLLGNGEYAVVDRDTQEALIFQALFNLNSYVGREVIVKVINIKYQVMPVAGVSSFDPVVVPGGTPDADNFAISISSSIPLDEAFSWF